MVKNILLIGNASGRLSCLAQALHEPGHNLHIVTDLSNYDLQHCGHVHDRLDVCDPTVIYDVTALWDFDLAVISNEAPLAAGVVDQLLRYHIPTFGPTQALAKIETSKIYARQLLDRCGIPGNPVWRSFEANNVSPERLEHIGVWMESLDDKFVVKNDGLAGGKGVYVMGDHFETRSEGIQIARRLLQSGQSIIVEDRLDGLEFSLMSFTDGCTVVDMPPVYDCKRLLNGDEGPQTGGMGAWTAVGELPTWLSKETLDCASATNRAVLSGIQDGVGAPYRGIIYGSYIVCRQGLRVIEFNARFGDPEIMNVFPLLDGDFAEIALACATGTLSADMIGFRPGYTVCKYLVPNGHPNTPFLGAPINLKTVQPDPNLRVYRGSLDNEATTTSRSIAFVGIGDSYAAAEQIAERACQSIPGTLLYHRTDIGTEALFELHQARFKLAVED